MKPNRPFDVLDDIARDYIPDNTDLVPQVAARLKRTSPMMTLRTRPLLAVLIAVLILLALSGAAYALGRTLGFIPGIGLIDNTSGIRVLASPSAVTRDGVTLTISSVFVYSDRVELAYEVTGIAAENNGYEAPDAAANPTAFCGGVQIGDAPNTDGDARLVLPDGAVLQRDHTGKFPQNAFAMTPVYSAKVPASVTKMTLVLDCLPFARHGAVPEQWSVPIELKSVPAGTLVGAPVIEVEPTDAQAINTPAAPPSAPVGTSPTPTALLPTQAVTMAIRHIVRLDSAIVVYFSLDVENRDPSLVSIMPLLVYGIDSQGQRISMIGNYVWEPFEHRVGSEFQFTTQTEPAAGPLTVVVEKAVAYYAPGHVEPRQATPAELEFVFDAGENPQPGQSWNLDRTINLAGYPIKVISARATTYDEAAAQYAPIPDSQGYLYGYDFTLETAPSVKMLVEMAVMAETPLCDSRNPTLLAPESNAIHHVILCRDAYPKGRVTVQIWQLAVLLDHTWQATWQP